MERQITNISECIYQKNDFLMIDILMSLLSKDDVFENFLTVDKKKFASVSLSNQELQLEFGSVSKKDPLFVR